MQCAPGPPTSRLWSTASRAAEEYLDHESHILRVAARDLLTVIAKIESLEIEPALLERWAQGAAIGLQTDPTPEGRAAAARLLAPTGGPGTASGLAKTLLSGNFAERAAAEEALTALAQRTDGVAVARGVFPLTEPGSRRTEPVRAAALRILGATKHRDAEEVLEQASEDGDVIVRRAANEGLERLRAK